MGFLSSLTGFVSALGQVAAPLITAAISPTAAIAAGVVATAAPPATPKAIAAAVAAQARAVVPTVAGLPALAAPRAIVGAPGLKNVVTTTVRTTDPAGNTVGIEVLEGRPFLMRKDFVTAKRVIKALRKAAARIPKQAVKPSKTKMLTDAVIDNAMRNVTCPPKGAPPC